MLNSEKQRGKDGKIYLREAVEGFYPESGALSECFDGWFPVHASGNV